MHLADTRERARADVAYGLEAWARYAQDVLSVSPVPREVTDIFGYLTENKRAVIGTPDDAIAAIERAQDGAGGFGVVLLMAHDWADWEATNRSYELFARYVMPHFTGLNVQRQASMDWVSANRDAFMGAGRAAKEKATRDYAAEKGRGKA